MIYILGSVLKIPWKSSAYSTQPLAVDGENYHRLYIRWPLGYLWYFLEPFGDTVYYSFLWMGKFLDFTNTSIYHC